jgi:hypothetical protein
MVKELLVVLLFGLIACNVEEPPSSTGGVPPAGNAGAKCGRGAVVVNSDYTSTNISITSLDGVTQSASFVSSGSAKPGLSLALSGDVVVPSTPPASGRVVLIDRFGKNVLTWMDLATAKVLGQLQVGAGFESNPQDYLEVDASRAFVSRAGVNAAPGREPNDAGSDVLIVDFTEPAIVGSVSIPEEEAGLLPSPAGLTELRANVAVSLGRMAADFSRYGEGRIVGISKLTNTIAWAVDIPGVRNCGRLVLSPSKKIGAVSCAGAPDPVTQDYALDSSFVILFDTSSEKPVELRRHPVGTTMGAAIQPNLAFVNDETLFALGFGQHGLPGDVAASVSVASGAVTVLASAGGLYKFGDVRCSPQCGDVCLVTDAERNVLRRWQVDPQSRFTAMPDAVVDTTIGLPPRTLGTL